MSQLFSFRSASSPPKRSWRPRRISPIVAVAVLVLGASTLAACGGASGAASSTDTATSASTAATGTTTGAPGANGPNSAAFTKYAACLKKNGVDLPAGGPGGAPGTGNGPPSTVGGDGAAPPVPGGDNSTFQKAQTACASLRPAGANGGFPGAGGANSAATAAFRNCLKINGVTNSTARTGAKFKKAMASCASLLPQRGTPPTTTGSS